MTLHRGLVTSVVFGATCAALTLVPNEARAVEDLAITPGILISAEVGGPRAVWGFGVECSLVSLIGSSTYPGSVVGGVVQAQMLTDGTFRGVLAAEGAYWGAGAEFGLAYRSGNAQRESSLALHVAPFLSVGYSWVSYSLNVSLTRAQGVPRLEHFVNFGPKVPFVRYWRNTLLDDGTIALTDTEWRLYSPSFGSGRPLRIDGEAQLAELSTGDASWCVADASKTHAGDLDVVERATLAALWSHDARLEHASVATFARLSLELLSLAAPPALLRGAHEAALDEIDHAQRCLSIAAHYAGTPRAPGRLSAASSGGRVVDHRTLAVEALVEGCLGEGIAAAQCFAAAEGAEPAVRAALTKIAHDEARHAELAWAVLAWCEREGGSEVRDAVSKALREALDRGAPEAVRDGLSMEARQRGGRLGPRRQRAVARAVMGEVEARYTRTRSTAAAMSGAAERSEAVTEQASADSTSTSRAAATSASVP